MKYKFYRAQVTGSGYIPQGDCKAVLTFDEDRQPSWSEMSDEFRNLCLPWFQTSVVMSKTNEGPEPLVPYSEEALDHLSKHQLPSQGYIMMKVDETPQVGPPYGHHQAPLGPPPGLLKKK